MFVNVGRIIKPHGVRGEVSVSVSTDEPELRFATGATFVVDSAEHRSLRVARTRWHGDRLLVVFDGVTTRDEAERLRGAVLQAAVDDDEQPDDPNEFYDRQLVGLRVVDTSGVNRGVVREVLHSPHQDLLAVSAGGGDEALVPFVEAIVPVVDLAAGHVVVDASTGLFDHDEHAENGT